MLNFETFNKETQPTESELKNFIGIEQFTDLHNHLCENYKINPKIAYSNCAMDNNIWRGWNITSLRFLPLLNVVKAVGTAFRNKLV